MKTDNQNSGINLLKKKNGSPNVIVDYYNSQGEPKESRYDLSILAELLNDGISPLELATVLREVHHRYASSLIEDFMEADDYLRSNKIVEYSNSTLENFYYLKLLADRLTEVEMTETLEPEKI